MQYFEDKAPQIKDFLRSHRNIKLRLVLVCLMEQKRIDKRKTILIQDKSYFHSESTDVKEILFEMIYEILDKFATYQRNGSGWYFKNVLNLEIHTVDYKPMKESSYTLLTDFIMKKKAITNIQNKDQKCFLWCVLRSLHPINFNDTRLTDLKQYENDLNFKDITKFESQNLLVPGINEFSVNDNNKFYPLRMTQKDCGKTIDLFLFEQDGKSHYTLTKNFSLLFRSQITSRTNGVTHICKKCFTHSTKKDLFEKHIAFCSTMKQLL